jgi:hypothetical protein
MPTMMLSNLTGRATAVFRWLAYAGTAAGIIGLVLHPAEAINELSFVFIVTAALAAAALFLVFVAVPGIVGRRSVSFEGRPTIRQARLLLACLIFPLSSHWSFALFFIICNGLLLSGLAIMIGHAWAPDPDVAPNTTCRPQHSPAQRLQAAFIRVLDRTRRPLDYYTPGEVAAHADLFGRDGRIKVSHRTKTATVITRDGYRAAYRLDDGTRIGGTE